MEPHVRKKFAIVATLLGLVSQVSAQTLTNAESKALLNEVRIREEADRARFGIVGIEEYRMNGVKMPPTLVKMPPTPRRTCYFLGKIVEVENGKVVFDDQIESMVREIRCPSQRESGIQN